MLTKTKAMESVTKLCSYSNARGYKVLLTDISIFASDPLMKENASGIASFKVSLSNLLVRVSTISLTMPVSASTVRAAAHPKRKQKFS